MPTYDMSTPETTVPETPTPDATAHETTTTYDFDTPVDRRGTWSIQWDGAAERFGADGLLPFTISDMDFRCPPPVLAALQERVAHGVFGYTDWQNEEFRSAVRDWYRDRHDTELDTTRLVYAPSVLSQLSQLLRMWTEPGDAVVVHTPVYDGFRRTVTGLGRELREVPLDDPAALDAALAGPRARVLLLCSPHNPTGRVWTEAELTSFASLAQRYGAAVISDEIHADFVHAGRRHLPWSRFGQGRWALITSGTKAFNFPSLTGSYGILGDAADHAEFVRRMQTGEGLGSPAVLSLTAHIAAYREGAGWLDAVRAYVAGNLALVASTLNSAFPELSWAPPQAGYLAWIDLRALGVEEGALQRELVEGERVAVMPGGVYGAPGFVRLNVGCARGKVGVGVAALVRALGRLT